MTNSLCIAMQFLRRCPNRGGYNIRKHVLLQDGRTKAAQVYPPELCKAICKGLIKQIAADRDGQFLLTHMEYDENQSSGSIMNVAKQIKEECRTVEEEDPMELEMAWDDVSGAELDPKMVRKAREEEIQYVRKMNLYEKVPISQCYETTGKAPITVRWIDINKGDQSNPNYRSRLVAREINTHKRDDLFAATPPLEALKLILSLTATSNRGEIVMINDISRAFFHAKAKRDVFVQLPNEDKEAGDEQKCGKLKYSMYGTRDAAQNWYHEYSSQLTNIGFQQGQATPCVFYHPDRGIRTYIHGDDYVSTGKPQDFKWMKMQLESKYTVKTETLGPGPEHKQQVKILNRIVSWGDTRGLTYEADPRHTEIIIKQLQLTDAKTVTTPGTKEEGNTSEDNEHVLSDKEATDYRAIVARCNYLAPDRPDIAFTVKELARAMAKPTRGDLQRLKRLARYLKGKPRLTMRYAWQPAQTTVTTYSDADWAGCRKTRKSTTGGCIMLGAHCIKAWSKTQALIALSSGESELYASLKASAETMGVFCFLFFLCPLKKHAISPLSEFGIGSSSSMVRQPLTTYDCSA